MIKSLTTLAINEESHVTCRRFTGEVTLQEGAGGQVMSTEYDFYPQK